MPDAVTGDRDVARPRRRIERQFPHLAPAQVTWLGAGMDSDAYLVNGDWVFRFPKRVDVDRMLAVERALLPALAPAVPVAIPHFAFHGVPDADSPLCFAGYRRLPGEPACDVAGAQWPGNAIAAQLGAFLTALHAYPPDVAQRRGAQMQDHHADFGDVRASAAAGLEAARRVLVPRVVRRVRDYLAAVAPPPPPPWPACLVHNDLAAEHVLVDADGTRVTGVIDWGDVAIGDPAVDFVGLFTWGGDDFVRAVLARYGGPVDERVLERVRPWGIFRAVQDIEFGLTHGQAPIVEIAGRRLAEL